MQQEENQIKKAGDSRDSAVFEQIALKIYLTLVILVAVAIAVFFVDKISRERIVVQKEIETVSVVDEAERTRIFSQFFPSAVLAEPLQISNLESKLDVSGYEVTYTSEAPFDSIRQVRAASTNDSEVIFRAIESMKTDPLIGRHNEIVKNPEQNVIRTLIAYLMKSDLDFVDSNMPLLGPNNLVTKPSTFNQAVWITENGDGVVTFIHVWGGQQEVLTPYWEKYPPNSELTKRLAEVLNKIYSENHSFAFRKTLSFAEKNIDDSFAMIPLGEDAPKRESLVGHTFDFIYYTNSLAGSNPCDVAAFPQGENPSNTSYCEAFIETANGEAIIIPDEKLSEVGGFPYKWLDSSNTEVLPDDNILLFQAGRALGMGMDSEIVQGTYDVLQKKTTHRLKYRATRSGPVDYKIIIDGQRFLITKIDQMMSIYHVTESHQSDTEFLQFEYQDELELPSIPPSATIDLKDIPRTSLELLTSGDLRIFLRDKSGTIQASYILHIKDGTVSPTVVNP